jgi:exodeoxyribonuclease VIII
MKDTHISLDLETLGQKPGAPVVSIGAVAIEGGRITREFYAKASLYGQAGLGFTMDESTVVWWLAQSEEARKELTSAKRTDTIKKALERFALWLEDFPKAHIWGNGSDFDNAILDSAYSICGYDTPWRFWQNRCLRTVKNCVKVREPKRDGVHHNALDDARYQARLLIAIYKQLSKGGVAVS